MTDALTKRKEIKARKPVFLAQDTHKKKRIRQRWRRPRGLQSKIRLNKRGYRRGVSSGWRSPAAVRGLSPEGLVPVRVETLVQLNAIETTVQGALVSGRVSMRTKKVLYDAAAEKGITILNRDAKVFEERFAAKMAERASRKKELSEKRKRQEKLKKDIEKTVKSGVAAEGLKDGARASKTKTDTTATDAPETSSEQTTSEKVSVEKKAPATSPDEPRAPAPKAPKRTDDAEESR